MATDSARAALGADAATPEPPAAAAGDGFVTYDQLRGPELDPGRWSPARLPLPTGDQHLPLEGQGMSARWRRFRVRGVDA